MTGQGSLLFIRQSLDLRILELHQGKGFLIAEPMLTSDHRRDESSPFLLSTGIELEDCSMRQPFDSRFETADSIAQLLRQHGDDPISEIHTVPSLPSFLIESRTCFHIVSYIRNVYGQFPSPTLSLRDTNGVVEVFCVFGIDRENVSRSPVLSTSQLFFGDDLGNQFGFCKNFARKLEGKSHPMDHLENIDARRVFPPQDLSHFRHRKELRIRPIEEAGQDDISRLRIGQDFHQLKVRRETGVLRRDRRSVPLPMIGPNDLAGFARNHLHDASLVVVFVPSFVSLLKVPGAR
jgi:hypothetical protein